jgi:AcrR family transcriptional regulator
MQRRSSQPVDTRGEIIEKAQALFGTKGYDATSVQTIIDTVGISKGTFYHHFASKEDLLDAVIVQMTHEALEAVEPTVADTSLDAVAKTNRFMATMRQWRLAHIPMVRETLKILLRDENAIIRQKMHQRILDLTRPLLARIITQGVEEGVFHTSDPDETATLVLQLSNSVGDRNSRALMEAPADPEHLERVFRRANVAIEAIERILGAPPGSLDRVQRSLIETFSHRLGPTAEP